MTKVEPAISNDPLLYDFELPLQAVFYPLGFSVKIETNSPEVLAGAEESWGHFRKAFDQPPVHLRIGVVASGPKECPSIPQCRGQNNLVSLVSDAQNFIASDLRQGFAFGWLTQAAVEERAYFRYHFLEGTALLLLTHQYLTPIHAACVALNGRGILLCGDSGAGKSSLAYACARRGWTFLADDGSRLVRHRKGRVVVGNPHQMRFRESAVKLFPELKDQRITTRVTGEMAIELATATLPEIATTSECPIDYVVFLNRQDSGPASLEPFRRDKALRWLEQVVTVGEPEVRDAQRASLRNLLTAEVCELHYSDLPSAVSRLETMVWAGD